MKVSLICTVLNEGAAILPLLDSLAAQTRQPDELIFVDGGSTDNTVEILRAYDKLPLRVLVAPGVNISTGRNIAIEAATGPLIASTDAGVRLDKAWLAELCRPFTEADFPAVVGGFFLPDPKTTFEVAMGATVLPAAHEIDPATFLPSSRSIAFRKSSWAAVGGYPEWLDYCEDLIFDIRLQACCGPFIFVPQAIAYFRPRGSLRAFCKQYYRYARGDGKSDLWRRRHAIRYSTYLAGIPLLLMLGWRKSRLWWGMGALLALFGMFLTPYRRLPALWHGLSYAQKLHAIALVPLIRIIGDIAKMVGYPVGWVWRLKRLRHQPELRWR